MRNYREKRQESGPGTVSCFWGELSCFPRSIAVAFINQNSIFDNTDNSAQRQLGPDHSAQ